ncbi:MAG: hypothetical protein GY937_05480 [bacterium]|nr:hypothetical protein [bacterium]
MPNNPVWLEKRPHLGLAITESLDAKFGSFQEPAHLAEVGKLFSDYGIAAKLG